MELVRKANHEAASNVSNGFCTTTCDGLVSRALTQEFYEARVKDLEGRLEPPRLEHSRNVSKTAEELALIYGVNAKEAALAGLLHDWDKEYDDPGILARVSELGLGIDPELMEIPRLLHGPTGAVALSKRFSEIPGSVIHAIDVHTTGAFDMSPLDMCIYVADAIEPGRRGDKIREIRELVGALPLEDLFVAVHGRLIVQAIEHGRKVYSVSLAVWNAHSTKDGHYVKH